MWLINWTLVEVPSSTSDACIVKHFPLRGGELHVILPPSAPPLSFALAPLPLYPQSSFLCKCDAKLVCLIKLF